MPHRSIPLRLSVAAFIVGLAAPAAAEPTVIEITQTACQFLEAENGVDHDFQATSKADCERINLQTGVTRIIEAEPLRLTPGDYVFRITNTDVDYELGFWLREQDYDWRNPIDQATKISVSGGGLFIGQTQEYEVELKPGVYYYSCPFNPTPNYVLIVEE